MSQDDGLDRRLTAWLDVETAPHAPTDLRLRFAEGVGSTRQRPAWATTERWISMETRARLGGVPRLVIILVTIGLLAALAAGAYVIGSDGPVRNGRIAFTTGKDIYTVAPDGRDRRLLVEGSDTLAGLAWSPDGTRLAYWTEGSPPRPWQLTVVDADGSDPTEVASGGATIGDMFNPRVVDWSPDGSKLAFTAQTIGGPQRACDTSSDEGPCTMRVFVAEVDADASTDPVQIGDPDMSARTAAWSPDGRTIAFTSEDAQKGGDGLYLMDADGGNVRRIDKVFGTGGSFGKLAWSPDGTSIAAATAGHSDIWVFASDGSTETMVSETPEDPTDDQGNPASGPDGSTLPQASAAPGTRTKNQGNPAYARDGALAWSGWLLEEGSTPRTMAVGAPPWSWPVWSPDGRFIAGPTDGDVVIIDRESTIVARIEGATFEYPVSWQPLPG